MRPDRIVVGEIRDAAALDMLQAMNTGHDGSISTLHANTPRDALVAPRDHGADGGHGPARPRHPRAGRQRRRPHHPADPSQGRHPPHHRDHRDRGHGGRHHHHPGRLPLRLRRRRRRERQVQGRPQVHGPAAPLPRAPHRPRRAGRPGRSSPPEAGCDDVRAPARRLVGAVVARRARHRRCRRAGPGRGRDHHRPRRDRRRHRLHGALGGRRPEAATVDPSDVAVEVDGERSTPRPRPSPPATSSDPRSSSSTPATACAGGKFDAATAAVDAFLDAAPPTCDRPGRLRRQRRRDRSSPPRTTRRCGRARRGGARAGHRRLRRHARGRGAGGRRGSRSLLVLSDGADTGSDTTLEVATNDALDDGVVVDVVSLGTPAKAEALATIADDTGGAVIPADPAALGSVFADQADALAEQLLLTFELPDDVERRGDHHRQRRGRRHVVRRLGLRHPRALAGPDVRSVVDQGKALVSKPVMLGRGAGRCSSALSGCWSPSSTGPRADVRGRASPRHLLRGRQGQTRADVERRDVGSTTSRTRPSP